MQPELHSTHDKKETQTVSDDLHKRWMYENESAKNLSLTDYFAAHALTGLIQHQPGSILDEKSLVSTSYDFAEAMVRERSRRYSQ